MTWASLEYLLGRTCSKPIQVWLLVSCLMLLLFRLAHIVGDTEAPDEMYEPWCFNLFTTEFKLHTVVVAGLLYPFFVFWVLLGTVWYAIVQTEPDCFKDPQQSWYIMLWLVIFYIWIIAYTTAISTSVMVLIRQRQLEGQYNRLLEQYEGQAAPFFLRDNLWQAEGLSPGSIGSYEPHCVTQEETGRLTCSICIDEAKQGEKIRTIDCGHSFHMACIDPWLLRHGECPNCKRNLRRHRDIEEPLLPQ